MVRGANIQGDRLKRANEAIELEKIREKMQENAKKAHELAQSQIYAGKHRSESQGQDAAQKWDRVGKMAQELIDRGLQGYDTWTSEMLAIFAVLLALNEAIDASNPLGKLVDSMVLDLLKKGQMEKAFEAAKKNAEDYAEHDPDALKAMVKQLKVEMPKLQIGIECDAEGHFSFPFLNRSDAAAMNENLERTIVNNYGAAIIAWLDEQGFDFHPADPHDQDNPNNRTFTAREGGRRLTTEEFKRLHDDPQKGLNAFVADKLEMIVESMANPTFAPRAGR